MKSFLLPGPAGKLELLTRQADFAHSIKATVIICHPHPLFGGTMQNKVVTTLARAFHELGLNTIQFNFRGVGKSEGVHDEGIGETEDVLAIAEWVKIISPEDQLWLAGFSFGGFVAANAATRLPVKQLITVAPQVSRFYAAHLPPITCPWLMIQGEADEVIPPQDVYDFVANLNPQPKLIRFPQTSHFFHGKLLELRECIKNELNGA